MSSLRLATPQPAVPPPAGRACDPALPASTLWRDSLAVLALGCGLSFALFAAAWKAPATTLIGQGPDPLLFVWFLRWTPYAVSHGLNPLFTTFLDAPRGVNLMWNTWVPLIGLLLSPITLLRGPVVAFNLGITVCPALSAWTAYLAIRRFVRSRGAAAWGALLYGFSPFVQAQALGHLHMVAAFGPPLLLMLAHDLVRGRRGPVASGLWLGLLCLAQLAISEEMLAMELIAMVLLAGAVAGGVPAIVARQSRRFALAAVVAAGLIVLVAGPALVFQFVGPQHVSGPGPDQNVFVSDLLEFVLPTSSQALALPSIGGLRVAGTQYEAGAYVGLPLLTLLTFAALRWRHDPRIRLAAVLVAQFALLSLGVTIHIAGAATPVPVGLLGLLFVPFMGTGVARFAPPLFVLTWVGISWCPVLEDIVPARLMTFAFLSAGFVLAIFVERLPPLRVRPPVAWRSLRPAIGWPLAGLVLLAIAPRWPFPVLNLESPPFQVIPSFFAGQARPVPAGSVALVVPYASNFEARAMLWQSTAGMRFRMPEGYALIPGPSFDPPSTTLGQALEQISWTGKGPELGPALRTAMLANLREWHVRTVIIGPMEHEQQAVALLSFVLQRPPEQVGGVKAWFDV